MVTYATAHDRVARARGKASTYRCEVCDRPARDWAYTYTDPEEIVEDGRPYSLDVSRYAPMCKSCHRLHDFEKDPAMRERFLGGSAHAHVARAALAEKIRTDPDFAERVKSHARAMSTPESRAAGGYAAHRKRLADPAADQAYRAARRETGLAVSKTRRVCSCGLESNPGAIGRHQKATGHTSPNAP